MQPTKRNVVKDYFSFTRKERRAVFLLLFLTLFLTVFPYTMQLWVEPPPDPVSDPSIAAFLQNDSTSRTTGDAQLSETVVAQAGADGPLFAFDPNTAGSEVWKQLGVGDRTIQTILKYRSKGGRFKQPSDLYRIYGLSKTTADKLIPYVRLTNIPTSVPLTAPTHRFAVNERTQSEPVVDVNAADPTAWKQLRGIGPGYAKRITGYRNKLGGFVRIEQVGETFGLPDSIFQRIRPFLKLGNGSVRRLSINQSGFDELKAHPYISTALARAIIQYREQHGLFPSIEALRKLYLMDEALYLKLAPYLKE